MIPRATYRLQFNNDFSFVDAAAIAPYLARLGVSHVYASPWLKARPGSMHGYDIVDHHALNPELGAEADFEAMVLALRANGLGQILDFVPNHMGVGGSDNPLWLDVLEWGPDSAFAGWFDIDWEPESPFLRDKLLVPFLSNQYGLELDAGKLVLRFDQDDGSFAVWAYDTHELPICPLDYRSILGEAHPELERLGDAFASLPEWRPQIPRRAYELKAELARCARANPEVRAGIEASLRIFSGTPGDRESWNALNQLIQRQHWRAAHFRVAADDINYRRFFDINELAGLRMELPDVFDHAHELVLRLLAEASIDGLRIDHVDGLLNPKEYLKRLRGMAPQSNFYLAVEKILANHESLREDWPIDGSTGYEFVNLVLGLLIDPASEEALTRHYVEFTGERRPFLEVLRNSKLRIMRNEMASELNVLAREAARIARQQPRTADFTHNVLRRAIREVVAHFPVYRTYVDFSGNPTDDDRRDITWAMKQARAQEHGIDSSVFDFVCSLLTGELVAESRSGFSRHAVLRFAMKLQQYSGPVMAKGLEDTACYRYNRFVALNEVGGRPDHFSVSVSGFHRFNSHQAKRWPHSMLSTSTHDTKRGEDTRARLAILSEMPDVWARQTRLWSHMLRARRGDIERAAPPDPNDEYLLYQLLVGSWPMELLEGQALDPAVLARYRDRVKGAMIKSIREAKLQSTWAAPNKPYEDAVLAFIDGALDPEGSSAFFAEFVPFVKGVARFGALNSVVQTALKLTAPGMPDIYQGAELWDLSLMDPDNRRPVDFAKRSRMLADLERTRPPLSTLLNNWRDGAVKLWVIARLLAHRTAEPELFSAGSYEPLAATGAQSDCVVAFARAKGDRAVVTIASRFQTRRKNGSCWGDTAVTLPRGCFHNVLTDSPPLNSAGTTLVGPVLAEMPVAVLIGQTGS
ncbi:MAG TPA: malto-oligosyltrehalose synthase [Bryobacteraceae bacterium]|nr:malto-oligosyltrehalose synthase [Bryobacteraceae bacterium]